MTITLNLSQVLNALLVVGLTAVISGGFRLMRKVDKITYQLNPNGGQSLVDKVSKMQTDLQVLTQRFDDGERIR